MLPSPINGASKRWFSPFATPLFEARSKFAKPKGDFVDRLSVIEWMSEAPKEKQENPVLRSRRRLVDQAAES